MQWQQDNYTYRATSAATTLADLKQALETCTAKAIALLNQSIQEDSLYLLFEWNNETNELTIVVTDANKCIDSPTQLHLKFSQLAVHPASEKDALVESIHFLLKDYLASCSAFFAYSLVAIFHSSTRDNSQLL